MTYYLTLIVIIIATITDLRSRRIPNWLTLSASLLGLMLNGYQSGLQGLGVAVLGFIVGLSLLFIPFAMGGIGAGDVKLLAAIGAIMGVKFVFYATCYAAIAGGVLALGMLIIKGELPWVILGLRTKSYRTHATFPYGVAIALGTIYYGYLVV